MLNELQHGSAANPIHAVMKSAHQLGVMMRSTRNIVRSATVHDICRVVEEVAQHFSISGCFRATTIGTQSSCQFGSGISRQHCVGLSCFSSCNQKLSLSENFLVFKTPHLLLVILTADQSEEDVDILKDNLAILVDVIEFWLQNCEQIAQREQQSMHAKLSVASDMNDIIHTMLRFSQHLIESHQNLCQNLLSNLLVMLPTLALEADQEDAMISMVTHANNEHGRLIELQVNHNAEMREIMNQAVSVLVDYMAQQESLETISEGEGGDITLF